MKYADELTKSMIYLSKDKNYIPWTSSCIPRHCNDKHFESIPKNKLYELPVAEEMQLGISNGLALNGHIPVSIFPRWNFLYLLLIS